MLDHVLVAVHAFWVANMMLTKYAVGVTQRVMRLQDDIDAAAKRFRAGKVMWRPRGPVVARDKPEAVVPVDPAERAAAVDAAEQRAAMAAARRRRPVYALPPYYGWLANLMPNSAPMLVSKLEAVFRSDEMRALMLATPVVALKARPVFKMLKADERLLLVPEGYTGRACGTNSRYYKPEPKTPTWVSDYVPPFVVPEDYDEERDGRTDALRDPTWSYKAYETYRSYLYYYMNRKPVRREPVY